MGADVAGLIDALRRSGGEPPPSPADPYAIVLHENAGYLVDDDRRDRLYRRLTTLAPTPVALLAAPRAELLAIARDGGMRPEERVERWRAIASVVLDEADGDLDSAVRTLPLPRARKLLARFPSIGTPGVDRILLFAGVAAVPSVDSNGLRVLERYGAIPSGTAYATAYRQACAALAAAFGADAAALRAAYGLLRRHGKTVCRRAAPECARCVVRDACPVGSRSA